MATGRAGRRRRVAIAAVLVTAIAGCGGGEGRAPAETGATGAPEAAVSTPSEPASAPARAAVDTQAFLAVADERCARTFVELDAVEYPADSSLPSNAAPLRQVASINREQLEDLRAIAPPAGDEEVIGDLLDTATVGVEALDELVGAAGADDVEAYDQALVGIEQSAQETFDQASAYGFATCFTPPAS